MSKIINSNDLKNPFIISQIEIDGLDVSKELQSIIFEENIFSVFMKGTLNISKISIIYPNYWKNKELGFLNRKIKFKYSTDIQSESDEKELEFIIYSIKYESDSLISLLFTQESEYSYLTNNFCDGWNEIKIDTIIKEIFTKYINNQNIKFGELKNENKISFTNPNWVPVKTINYLLPRMKSGSNSAFLLFSNSKNELLCKPINEFLNKSSIEDLKLVFSNKEGKQQYTVSEIIEYKIHGGINRNVILEMINNMHGLIINEYDILSKELKKPININNIKMDIKQLGTETNLYDLISNKNKFSFSNLNKETYERSNIIYEYIKNNNLTTYLYGNNSRNIGDIVDIDITTTNSYFINNKDEYNGNCMIGSIIHMFTYKSYLQKIVLFKSGLNKYKQKELK